MSDAPRPLQLGAIKVLTPMLLAPMAGVTSAPFRHLCIESANANLPFAVRNAAAGAAPGSVAVAGLYVNEMLTSRAISEKHRKTHKMLAASPLEAVRSIQLYGVDPGILSEAVNYVCRKNLADHIDLNFGCPVPKVTRKGGGAALPWKTDLFGDIVSAVVNAVKPFNQDREVPIPVTVKIRVGIDSEHETFRDAARIAQDAGVAAVTLHARTLEQYYSGRADWSKIAELVELLDIPVLGNGDVFSGEDALAMLRETGCAGVAIGRGAQGRPWIFGEIAAALWGQPAPALPTAGQVCDTIMAHARLLVDFWDSEGTALRDMRKHVGWYLRGFSVGGKLRGELARVSTLAELQERLSLIDPTETFPAAALGARGRAGNVRKAHLPYEWLNTRTVSAAETDALLASERDDEESITAGG